MAASYLTLSQIEEFHKNGLLVIENFVNQNEVKDMKDEILKLVDAMNPKEHKGVFSTTSHNQVRTTYLDISNFEYTIKGDWAFIMI